MAARARKTAPYRRIPSYYDFATHTQIVPEKINDASAF
jgi:hypothetical protein